MSEGEQATLEGGDVKKPEKKKAPAKPRLTMAALDEKYTKILEVLEAGTAKIDDLVIANYDLGWALRKAPAPQAGTAPKETGPDMSQYLTSREQYDGYCKILNRRDGEFAEKNFIHLLEQLCTLREDFIRLCNGMQPKIDTFSAAEVLSSFRAYGVDIENILTDAGVKFGTFTNPGTQVDTNHQRIVSVVPTTDPSKNGTVAQRMSNGYQYQGRTIVKEKVSVYRTASGQNRGPRTR